jgi:hypothetical protein
MLSLALPCASAAGPQRPRTHYQLLGVSPDERDPGVIEEAALRRTGEARVHQLTSEVECAQVLNEIAQAFITLQDPARRRDYDRALGLCPGPAALECGPARPRTAAPAEGTLELLLDEGGACDVKLVYQEAPRQPLHPF